MLNLMKLNTDVTNLIWSFVLQLRVSALNEAVLAEYELAKSQMAEVMDCPQFEERDNRADPQYWFKLKPWYTGLYYTDGLLRYQALKWVKD